MEPPEKLLYAIAHRRYKTESPLTSILGFASRYYFTYKRACKGLSSYAIAHITVDIFLFADRYK